MRTTGLLLLLTACSPAADPAPEVATSVTVDAGPTLDPWRPRPLVADAAPPPLGACKPLGGACATGADCLCGLGAGCEWDNVACSDAGACGVTYLPELDAGAAPDPCCSLCELAWDQGGTMAAWVACNATCGEGACPVTCLGADVKL